MPSSNKKVSCGNIIGAKKGEGMPMIVSDLRCSFRLGAVNDFFIVLIDCGGQYSLASDVRQVLDIVDGAVHGGIGRRRVFYVDHNSRYDEILLKRGNFYGIRPSSEGQRHFLSGLMLGSEPGPLFTAA